MGASKRIPLTMGKFAIVDAEDYQRLSQYKWFADKYTHTFYARRKRNGVNVKMHREILRAPAGVCCDHKNHNGLDNRRSNLRLCTRSQNLQNSRSRGGKSKYKGVGLIGSGRWQARICLNGERTHLGVFKKQKEAALAYDRKACELFGEFACLNFPQKLASVAAGGR